MNERAKKVLAALAIALIAYLSAYFSCVRTTVTSYKDTVMSIPFYRPWDSQLVHAVFTAAHLIDAAYLRSSHWAPRNRR